MKALKKVKKVSKSPWRKISPIAPKSEPSKILPNYTYRVIPR